MTSHNDFLNITDSLKEKWNHFVNEHPNGNIFQTPIIASFFQKVKGYEIALTLITDENDEVLGVLTGVIQKEGFGILEVLSSRCIIWGGALVKNNNSEILKEILSNFESIVRKKAIYIQIRNLYDTSEIKDEMIKFGFKYDEHLNFINTLEEPEIIVKKFVKTKQYQVKKGLETGAEISNPESHSDIKEFYSLLYDLYINKVKKPLPDISYFVQAYDFLISNNSAFIKLIKVENKIVGGILCFMDKKFVYDMYMVGMDKEHKKVSPTVLAIYSAMKQGFENAIPLFDFMGAGKPDEDYGVREFKGMFGGELVNYGRYEKIIKPSLYKIGVLGVKIKGKLKL